MSNQKKVINISELGRKYAKLVIEKHNYIVDTSDSEEITEDNISRLAKIESEFSAFFAKTSNLGVLTEAYVEAFNYIRNNIKDLKVLNDGNPDFDWTPNDGVLPQHYDIFVGEGEDRKRFISIADGVWAEVPVKSTSKKIEKIRKHAIENFVPEEIKNAPKVPKFEDSVSAFKHAIYCLFEAQDDHLNRFAYGIGEQNFSPFWGISPAPFPAPKEKPTTHELISVVVSGSFDVDDFENQDFRKILAKKCGVNYKDIFLVGHLQMRDALPWLNNPQKVSDLNLMIAKRIADGNTPVDHNDEDYKNELQNTLKISISDPRDDDEDSSLLIFSVIRHPNKDSDLFLMSENYNAYPDQEWVDAITEWVDKKDDMTVMVFPPTNIMMGIARLCTICMVAPGLGNAESVVVLNLKKQAHNLEDPLDFLILDEIGIPIVRSNIPAWVLGLLEEAIVEEMENMYGLDISIVSSNNFDLNSIPLHGDWLLPPANSTLH